MQQCHATVPAPESIPGPDPAKLVGIVEEFFRILAISRSCWTSDATTWWCLEGVHTLRQMLYDVFVESNQPLPPMGIKQWSAKLTPEQREIMHALPAATSDKDSLVSAMRTVVEAIRTAGRRAAVPCGCQLAGQTRRRSDALLQ